MHPAFMSDLWAITADTLKLFLSLKQKAHRGERKVKGTPHK